MAFRTDARVLRLVDFARTLSGKANRTEFMIESLEKAAVRVIRRHGFDPEALTKKAA